MSRMTKLLPIMIATLAIAPHPAVSAPTPEFPLGVFGNESVAATDN